MPCQAAFQAEVLSPLPLAALCFPRWDFPPLMASLSFPVGIIEFFWHHHIFHGSFEDIIFFSNDLTFFSLQFPKFSIKVTKHATEPMGEWKILLFSGELIFCFIMKRRLVYLAFQATVALMQMYKEKTQNHSGEGMLTRQRKNCSHFQPGLAVEALAWRLSGCLVATS